MAENRVAQALAEVAAYEISENRVAQTIAEVLHNDADSNVKVAQTIVEVARVVSMDSDDLVHWEHNHSGYVVTPYITLGMWDVNKYFKSIKHFVDNADANTTIYVDYRTDYATDWTNIGSVTSNTSTEISLYGTDFVTGKRIQFRFRFYTTVSTTSVDLQAWLLESIPSIPQKNSYTARFRLETDHITLFGERQYQTISAAYSALKSFVDQAAPVTMTTSMSVYNNKEVKLVGLTADPLVDHTNKEIMVGTLLFLDT